MIDLGDIDEISVQFIQCTLAEHCDIMLTSTKPKIVPLFYRRVRRNGWHTSKTFTQMLVFEHFNI